jgi:hypothetical protein
MSGYLCPVCGYPDLHEAPRSASGGASYEICPSCGFEFGVSDDDLGFTYEAWRDEWIRDGLVWQGTAPRPAAWSPMEQLKKVR